MLYLWICPLTKTYLQPQNNMKVVILWSFANVRRAGKSTSGPAGSQVQWTQRCSASSSQFSCCKQGSFMCSVWCHVLPFMLVALLFKVAPSAALKCRPVFPGAGRRWRICISRPLPPAKLRALVAHCLIYHRPWDSWRGSQNQRVTGEPLGLCPQLSPS